MSKVCSNIVGNSSHRNSRVCHLCFSTDIRNGNLYSEIICMNPFLISRFLRLNHDGKLPFFICVCRTNDGVKIFVVSMISPEIFPAYIFFCDYIIYLCMTKRNPRKSFGTSSNFKGLSVLIFFFNGFKLYFKTRSFVLFYRKMNSTISATLSVLYLNGKPTIQLPFRQHKSSTVRTKFISN